MKCARIRGAIPRRAAIALLLTLSISPAWCPEAPVLERLQQAMLAPYLPMTPDEMADLLASHNVRHLPPDFPLIADAVNESSRRQGLAPELVLAVIEAESEFRRDAVSERGAVGLMQLMPETAAELATELNISWTGEECLHDPAVNVALGSYYLRKMLRRFDDLDHALAAYNRGPYAPNSAGLPAPGGETAAYLKRIREILASPIGRTAGRSFGGPHPFSSSTRLTL